MSIGVIGMIGHLVTRHAERGFEPGIDFVLTTTRQRVKAIQLRTKPVLIRHLALEVTLITYVESVMKFLEIFGF